MLILFLYFTDFSVLHLLLTLWGKCLRFLCRIHFDGSVLQRKGQNNKCRLNWRVRRRVRGGWICWGQYWFLDECTTKRTNEFISSSAAKKKTSMSLIPMKMLMGRLSFSPHNILVLQSHTWIVTLKTISSCLFLIQTTPPSIRKENSLGKQILWLFFTAGCLRLTR